LPGQPIGQRTGAIDKRARRRGIVRDAEDRIAGRKHVLSDWPRLAGDPACLGVERLRNERPGLNEQQITLHCTFG
jgi:hypothetical protein